RPARALERALRDAIVTGRVPAGQRLPPTRSLAVDLGIARATVAEVYAQLTAEGWLEARTGAGTWVTATAAALPSPPSATPAPRRRPPRAPPPPGPPPGRAAGPPAPGACGAASLPPACSPAASGSRRRAGPLTPRR